MNKKILFLTGTRADFGKLKPLMKAVEQEKGLELYIFVTGMHMLPKYGDTGGEVRKSGFKNIYYFINQRPNDSQDVILANTIYGLSNYLHLLKPDMLIVHGDRVEALAGAISGALNNCLVAHIEGGEVSGAIDESIRHSVSKLVHLHFAANNEAKTRLIRMGEKESSIYVIGSPDIDLMISKELPALGAVKKYYDIPFDDNKYCILIYHPVTTQLRSIFNEFQEIMEAIIESKKNCIMVYPNNDPGADIIIESMELHRGNPCFKIFPSIRFEYFLTLQKNCEFIIGNSSIGIRGAPIYSVPSINIGNRQNNRFSCETIINIQASKKEILNAIGQIGRIKRVSSNYFGDGNSTAKFMESLRNPGVWATQLQKFFVDNE